MYVNIFFDKGDYYVLVAKHYTGQEDATGIIRRRVQPTRTTILERSFCV